MCSGLNSSLFGGGNSEEEPGGGGARALERSRTSGPAGACTTADDGGMPMPGLPDDFTLVI